MCLETGLIILSLVFLLLTVFAVIFILQFCRMAKNIAITLQTLNRSLPLIMSNLEEITSNIASATHTVNARVEGLSSAIKKLQSVLEVAANLVPAIKLPFFKTLTTLSAALKGARAFLNAFRSSG